MSQDIYFHIGAGKTGTSAIQAFLDNNRKILAEKYNFLYPSEKAPYDEGKLFNHAPILDIENGATTENFKSYLYNLFQSRNIDDYKTLLFSWEGTSEHQAKLIYDALTDLGKSFKVIIYIRRQDAWLESAWKQWGHKATNLADIVHFAERKTIDWFDILTSWANIVGKENIILKVYEKAALPNGLIHDFLSIFNIDEDYDVFIQPAQDYKSVNYGFTPEVIRLLQFCKPLYDSVHENKFFFFLDENLPEIYRKAPFSSYNILSDEERKKILKKYKSSNNKVANEFLNLEGEELFKDPVITEEPHQDLNIRSFAPILMSILVK